MHSLDTTADTATLRRLTLGPCVWDFGVDLETAIERRTLDVVSVVSIRRGRLRWTVQSQGSVTILFTGDTTICTCGVSHQGEKPSLPSRCYAHSSQLSFSFSAVIVAPTMPQNVTPFEIPPDLPAMAKRVLLSVL